MFEASQIVFSEILIYPYFFGQLLEPETNDSEWQ